MDWKNNISKIKRLLLIFISIFLIISFISKINSSCAVKFLNTKKTLIEESEGKRTGTSLGCRLNYIEASVDLIKENPLIGIGTGDSLLAMEKLYGKDKI